MGRGITRESDAVDDRYNHERRRRLSTGVLTGKTKPRTNRDGENDVADDDRQNAPEELIGRLPSPNATA